MWNFRGFEAIFRKEMSENHSNERISFDLKKKYGWFFA
ncbi:hypothetical protein ELI_4231 [Eubacterium callanderi]|uniref:Uncharacterized protein n=1 Tax=Eubacterium callanderi TaxID=53442 RepID=E3GPW0_9FIRM|nr:hypothetical protein ELI_4231 [Eubacterium callanderi]